MPTPNQDFVRRVLAVRNRDKLIRRAVTQAWTMFRTDYPNGAWYRRKGTRAAIVWEHSVQNVIDNLSGDPGFQPIPHDDTVSFVFDQAVLVRMKKADIELHTRNYPTPLATLFHVHEAELPGLEDLQRVEAAHVLNRFQTGINWIGIVAREKKRTLWQFEIEGGTVVELPPAPDRTQPAVEKVMKPKQADEPKREDEGE